MATTTNYPPESVWKLMGEWYPVPEASTNYANRTPEENTLRVGHENPHGRTVTRLEFTPSIAGVPEQVRETWTGPDGKDWSAIHHAGPVR
jgi:hypothetical protein